jgi:hypothetical protein
MQLVIRCLVLSVALAIAAPARAQQPPQPPADAGQVVANQIGMLFMQNAALTEQVQRQKMTIARLQKQLAGSNNAGPPAPEGAETGAPASPLKPSGKE